MKIRMTLVLAGLVAMAAVAQGVPQRVSYIESDAGKQHYIDLGFPARSGIEVVADMAAMSVGDDACFIGARPDSGDTRFYPCLYQKTGGFYGGYKTSFDPPQSSKIVPVVGTKYHVDTTLQAGAQSVVVNYKTVLTSKVAGEIDTGLNLFLFAANKGDEVSLFASARCYGVKIYDYTVDGHLDERVLVRDYKPCLDAEGNPCLHEVIDDVWYYPGGADKALAYGEILKGVGHYVEYIESTTAGKQYIDTEIEAATQYRSIVDFELPEVPTSACILGSAQNNGGDRTFLCFYYNGTFCLGNGNRVELNPKYPAVADTRYQIQTEFFRDRRMMTINGVEQTPQTIKTTADALSLKGQSFYLFANHNNGAANPVRMKLHGLQVWRSLDGKAASTLEPIADYHPCVDTAGKPGVYDAVSDRIFYNKASGEDFLTGPAIRQDVGAIVVAADIADADVEPGLGTLADPESGKAYSFTAAEYARGTSAYKCLGYTTSTSEDGVSWGAESALVESRACEHAFDGSWWRITWKYERIGVLLDAVAPEGADILYDSDTDPLFSGERYYPAGASVTLTAPEECDDGHFYAWKSSLYGSSYIYDRSIAVAIGDTPVTYTACYAKWTVVGESGAVKTISDGYATVEVEDGIVGTMTIPEANGKLDFTYVEADLGFKITGFKDWPGTGTHVGPATLAVIVAPDVESIGNRTFYGCDQLASATFGPVLHRVGRSAFYGCKELSSLTPSLSEILGTVDFLATDAYAFMNCAKQTDDIVVTRGKALVLPPSVLCGIGAETIDLSGCTKTVTFTPEESEANHSAFGYNDSLETVILPPRVANLPRRMLMNVKNLATLTFTGYVPVPENIGFFFGRDDYTLTIYLSRKVNPTAVEALKIRPLTDAEIAAKKYPAGTYEDGTLLGVFDEPTSGWGALGSSGRVMKMWVVDCKASLGNGLLLIVK